MSNIVFILFDLLHTYRKWQKRSECTSNSTLNPRLRKSRECHIRQRRQSNLGHLGSGINHVIYFALSAVTPLLVEYGERCEVVIAKQPAVVAGELDFGHRAVLNSWL